MSLKVDTSAVAEFPGRGLTSFLAGMMMIFAGMPQVTAENASEFYVRVSVIEGLIGAFRTAAKAEVRFTAGEARALAGLRTNARPFTRRQFLSEVNRLMNENVAALERTKT